MKLISSIKERKGKAKAEFLNALNKYTKVDRCVLCGKKIDSACNSHVVPRFTLKNIAEGGCIYYGYALQRKDYFGLGEKTGINNAHTFRLICKECDAKWFKNYENPQNLANFDNVDINLKKQMLCEMSIKAHLSHIYMKFRTMVAKDMNSSGKLGELEKEGKCVFVERIDINEHMEYIGELIEKHNSNKNPFRILYNRVLNYQTKIATQTVINFNFDLEGNKIYDPFCFVLNECRYFYLMILPSQNSTRVIFYIEEKNIKNVSSIIEQFNSLTEGEKLHFLFVSLVIHDQQFYIAPSLFEEKLKKDRKLINLYSKTNENEIKNQKALKNFKKYKNYLLPQ